MLTFTGAKSLFGTFTSNSSSANLTLGGTLINQADAEILNQEDWDFLTVTKTANTVASQQFYGLPYDMDIIKSISATVGTIQYFPKFCSNQDQWNNLNESTNMVSDTPEWYFITQGTIGFYPKPATSNNVLTMVYQQRRKDLSNEDYTTGTIVTATTGQTAIVGSGTAWTSKMNGFWIKIADGIAANTGDGFWYQIASVQSATTLTLVSPYGGASISGGSVSYIIGQTSLIPEDFQIVPVYRAAQIYFTSIQPDETRAAEFKNFYLAGLETMMKGSGSKITSPVIEEDDGGTDNPNLHPHY